MIALWLLLALGVGDNVNRLGCRACCSEPVLGFPKPIVEGCLQSGVDDLSEKEGDGAVAGWVCEWPWPLWLGANHQGWWL